MFTIVGAYKVHKKVKLKRLIRDRSNKDKYLIYKVKLTRTTKYLKCSVTVCKSVYNLDTLRKGNFKGLKSSM